MRWNEMDRKTNTHIMRHIGDRLLIVTALALAACGGNHKAARVEEQVVEADTDDEETIVAEDAEGFTVTYLKNGVRLVDIHDPQADTGEEGGTDSGDGRQMPHEYHLALVDRHSQEGVPEGYTRIEVPVRRVICMTALQLSNFTVLDAHDNIVGLTGTKNLYDEDILRRVEQGSITTIGMEGNFDTEKVMAANPDIIMISPFKRGGYEAVKETGITLVPHLGYKELTPLGQAEWMKYVAMLIGKEREANRAYHAIKKRYDELRALTSAVERRPVVMSGEMHGGNWFAIGGRNFLAQMFYDAGAQYVLADDAHSGGIYVDFERMYASAANADYWRILNSFPGEFSYDALRASDARNADFKAFRDKRVIYCNMRQTPYYEISPVEPDVMLADLVHIFHPGLLPPDYEPTFYRLLE